MVAETVHAPAAPTTQIHPLRNRHFLLWWIGATTSLFGDQFYLVALPWVVLQLTGSGLAMGTVAMAAGIPRAVLMLMGGAVSDRISPRKILMATASIRSVLVAAIGVLLWRHILQLWHVYVLASAFGVADAFAMPSAGPLMRSLVQPEQLPAANSLWQSSALLTGIVGPAPAGAITKALGAAWAFFLDAFSFLFVIAALWTVPDPPRAPSSGAGRPTVWSSIGEGLKYVGSDVALRSLVLLAAVLNFCLAGPLSVGLAYMASGNAGRNPARRRLQVATPRAVANRMQRHPRRGDRLHGPAARLLAGGLAARGDGSFQRVHQRADPGLASAARGPRGAGARQQRHHAVRVRSDADLHGGGRRHRGMERSMDVRHRRRGGRCRRCLWRVAEAGA
jgi:MFS family permease